MICSFKPHQHGYFHSAFALVLKEPENPELIKREFLSQKTGWAGRIKELGGEGILIGSELQLTNCLICQSKLISG